MLPRSRFLAVVLFVSLATSNVIHAQQLVMNQFVGATVNGGQGLLTFYKGNPANRELLSFHGMSFLTVNVENIYYSNSPYGGQIGSTVHPIDVQLMNGTTSKIQDTLRTVWKESGFDIVQDAYPVAFTTSGVIVLSVKIVNHTSTPLTTAAQFLLDNMNSNAKTSNRLQSANDNPYLIQRYGYTRNWQDCPPSSLPSFFLSFEFPPDSMGAGTIGIGYLNDSFPPQPLGLLPLSMVEFGDWRVQTDYTFGLPNPGDRTQFTDLATLLIGTSFSAHAFEPGVSDSVTEIMRTAYGTQEFSMCFGSKLVDINFFPRHVGFDNVLHRFVPNPFRVSSFVYNIDTTTITGLQETQYAPGLAILGGATQNGSAVARGTMTTFGWFDSVFFHDTTINISFGLDGTGLSQPVIFGDCTGSILIDGFGGPLKAKPVTNITQRTDSYDGSECNTKKTDILIVDTAKPRVGFKRIAPVSATNMAIDFGTLLPPIYDSVRAQIVVLDSMQDGQIVISITDTLGNETLDTFRYCTIPDKTKPLFWQYLYPDSSFLFAVKISDFQAWDRGLDSIGIVSVQNLVVDQIPVRGLSNVIISGHPVDSSAAWTVCLAAIDLAGNRSDTCFSSAPANVSESERTSAKLKIYPNPSADLFTIELPSSLILHP
ncbi:MAG: hypothetical protein Q8922_04610 [Bacteroidota bacterium]|nr:hypothetical protein [Bacteroidota bacterium]